ncbi:MAG: Gfo/Idh/MocA family oxidoreductase [Verrucomicrobiales bacterium]|nr:Gfo/Idh/MocA family oxidoreductase [Verrucomicrobiota bacterium JB025]
MQRPSRRQFLKSSAALGAGTFFIPNRVLGGELSKTLNVAAIGCGGKGRGDISEISKGNRIAFLCDIDRTRMASAVEAYPDATVYSDYREMFANEADKIDVVTVSTADHMHFPIGMEAIRLGKPVMVQKPLANTLWEARVMGNYAREKGVLTVMGNQGATTAGTRVLREWLEAGVIGEVKEVYYWTNRPIWPQGPGLAFPEEVVPEHINWDVWQGTCATERAYSSKIHPFAWRGFWDYGCGALGDIGCHSFNSAFWGLGLKGDFVVEASEVSEFDETIAPKRATIVYDFPAKGGRAAVKVIWQDGVNDPNTDAAFVRPAGLPADLELNREFGQVFVGTEGVIFVNDAYCARSPELFRDGVKVESPRIEPTFERVKGGPTQELCRAVRGEGPKPVSNFEDHAGPLTEMVLAGNLAVRSGKRIDWDSGKLEARGMSDLKRWIKREYRSGWEPKIS